MKFCQWASILTQRLAFHLLSAWGQKGWGHLLTARGLGVVSRPQEGGALAAHGGHQKPPLSCQHWVWEGWWRGTITKMVKGIASWEFPKEQSLVEDKPESGTGNILSVRPPPIWKKQVAFKWIFRWFYAFWDPIFFFFSFEMKLRRFCINNYITRRFMTLDLTNW